MDIDKFIKDNYKTMTNKEIAKAIGKTEGYVSGRLSRLQLKRDRMQKLVLLPGEEFRSLDVLGTKYQISNKGRIKNSNNKIMKPFDSHGYERITLSPVDGRKDKFLIHVLVATTFIPNPDNKPFVDHIDMNRKNNDASNLRWVTQSENEFHKMDNRPELKRHLSKFYTDDDYRKDVEDEVRCICNDIVQGKTNSEIAESYDIDVNRVSAIRNKRLWKSIGEQYF